MISERLSGQEARVGVSVSHCAWEGCGSSGAGDFQASPGDREGEKLSPRLLEPHGPPSEGSSPLNGPPPARPSGTSLCLCLKLGKGGKCSTMPVFRLFQLWLKLRKTGLNLTGEEGYGSDTHRKRGEVWNKAFNNLGGTEALWQSRAHRDRPGRAGAAPRAGSPVPGLGWSIWLTWKGWEPFSAGVLPLSQGFCEAGAFAGCSAQPGDSVGVSSWLARAPLEVQLIPQNSLQSNYRRGHGGRGQFAFLAALALRSPCGL